MELQIKEGQMQFTYTSHLPLLNTPAISSCSWSPPACPY